MKSYTDLEQSKILKEILSIESADMVLWGKDFKYVYADIHAQEFMKGLEDRKMKYVPCWSLAALLDVLPDEITDDGDVFRNMFFHLKGKYIIQYPRLTTLWPSLLSVEADNPIDACYEMICWLKENNKI